MCGETPLFEGGDNEQQYYEYKDQLNNDTTKDLTTEGSHADDEEPKSCFRETFLDDKLFWVIIVVLFLANIYACTELKVGMWFGFSLASYSAIGNDSIQTLGPFLASTKDIAWWIKWIYIASVFLGTTLFSWFYYDGDISYQRLSSHGFEKDPVVLPTSRPHLLLFCLF